MINEIDTRWLDEYNDYDKFYKDTNKHINFIYMYAIRSEKKEEDVYMPAPEIYKIKQEEVKLEHSNIVSKEELVFNINKNKEDTKLISIGLYNNKADMNEIINKSESITVIKEITYLDDIILEDTINYFQSLNSIIILFYKKRMKYIQITDNNRKRHTRKARSSI